MAVPDPIVLGGFTVRTDPNFLHQGEHAALGGGLRSKRLTLAG